jgi:hypothetical protein
MPAHQHLFIPSSSSRPAHAPTGAPLLATMDENTGPGPRLPYRPRRSVERYRPKQRGSLRIPKFWVSTSFPAFLTMYRVPDAPTPPLISDAIEGTIQKRTPASEIITTFPPDTDCKYTTSANYPSHSARPLSLIYRIDKQRPPHRHDENDESDESEYDDSGGHTQKHAWSTWSKLASETETGSDTEPSPETEWPSILPILPSAETDGPTTPTDSESSLNTPTPWLASQSAPVVGATSPTSRRPRPYASSTDEANTLDPSTIYSTPTSSPASDSASEIDATSATSRTPRSSRASSTVYSDTTYSPLSSTAFFSSSSRSLRQTSRKPTSLSTTQAAKTTTRRTSSSSSSSWDIIRPNHSSLHIVANITIYPDVPSNDIGPTISDPSPTPSRDASNLGVTSSGNVPLGVIVGTVFGIIFGGSGALLRTVRHQQAAPTQAGQRV